MTYYEIALARAIRAFFRTHHAYFARPDLLTVAHDEHLYWLARQMAHEARLAGRVA